MATYSQETVDLVREHFGNALSAGLSRYEAVKCAALATGLTMREVGLRLHPAGVKHKPKVKTATA